MGDIISLEQPQPKPALGTKHQIEDEIDEVIMIVKGLHLREPYDVMSICAALSARLTELSVKLHRIETRDNEYFRVRTMQISPMLDEVDRQFKSASRKVEIMRQELEAARGF